MAHDALREAAEQALEALKEMGAGGGYAAEGLRRALGETPTPVPNVRVKPLKWSPFRAETEFGYYHIDDQRDRSAEELKGRPPFLLSGSRQNLSRYETLEAARAAAQADFELRILSCLSTTATEGE